jgi:hypothetical protein
MLQVACTGLAAHSRCHKQARCIELPISPRPHQVLTCS